MIKGLLSEGFLIIINHLYLGFENLVKARMNLIIFTRKIPSELNKGVTGNSIPKSITSWMETENKFKTSFWNKERKMKMRFFIRYFLIFFFIRK